MSKGKFKCELCKVNAAEVQWFNHKNEELYICGKCKKIVDGEFCSLLFQYIWHMTAISLYKNIRTMTDIEVELIRTRLSFVRVVYYFLSIYEEYVLSKKAEMTDDGLYEIPIKGTNSRDLFNYVFVCDPVDETSEIKTFKFGFAKRTTRDRKLKNSIGVELSFSKTEIEPDIVPVIDEKICSLVSDDNFQLSPIWMVMRPLFNTTTDDMMFIMSFAHENLTAASEFESINELGKELKKVGKKTSGKTKSKRKSNKK